MCAINGITGEDRECVENMNRATIHRGPDGTGLYVSKEVTFGHNRLAIIDLSNSSAQPMQSDDKRFVITYNGELYNYQELRSELSHFYTFQTVGDTEVLLVAYIVWGTEMFKKVRGIFAFAVWDHAEKTLILARDHMGVKPLYYKHQNGRLQFSSELGAFTYAGNSKIDHEALTLYLSLEYVPSPRTLVAGVSKLPPGHFCFLKNGQIEIVDYQGTFSKPDFVSEKTLYETIEEGVTLQLVSDRPVGVFLSGGLDSSIVLHHTARNSTNVRTFSVDFEMLPGSEDEAGKFNTDAVLAAQTAKCYGAQHTTFTLGLDDVRKNFLKVYESLDEPIADASGMPRYFLSQKVRESGIVVALGGDGGDELFGGYNRHRALMTAYYFQFFPELFQKILAKKSARVEKLMLKFPVPIHLSYLSSTNADMQKMLKFKIDTALEVNLFESWYKDTPKNMHPLDAFMRVDRRTWLPDLSLALSDRFSMAHGLELRVPLLDTNIVSYSDTLSVYKKVNPFRGKNNLREAYMRHLPEFLFTQPKRGWFAPGAKWLRDPVIHDIAKEVLSSQYYNGLDQIIDWNGVTQMFDAHVSMKGYYRQPLWNILALQIWARKHKVQL